MCRHLALAGLCAVNLAFIGPAMAQDSAPQPSALDRQAVERIIHDYLLENPEIVADAIERLREKQRMAEEQLAQQSLASNHDAVFNDPAAPVGGNPEGDVTVVEFFDYRCGYCKRMSAPLAELLQGDSNIRLVFKEFPILGPESQYAARAALAAKKQDKYVEFHWALMGLRGALDEATVKQVAQSVGVDVAQMETDMEAPEIAETIRRSYALAEALNINGTPAFVIGEEIVRGAVSPESLSDLIAEARAGS